jgi:membrane protease subunit (stomatin/prohibitin family)
MELWDKLKAEFIDIIEWTDDTADTLVWRFARYHNQIKYGAQLTVRETQAAVFVNEGRIADVFKPGMYTLETRNLPVLSTLQGWKHGLDSPFRAEVYFVSTRQFTDLKWGTRNPIILRDPEIGPVRLRAFGTYAIRVREPAAFVKEIAGTNAHFSVEGISEQLRNLIVTRFSDYLAESGIALLDLASRYDEMSALLNTKVSPEFLEYGIELPKLLVENVSVPEEVERALDKRSSMGIVGDLDRYMKYQTGTAMETAAANPGGEAASGVGMGMGFAVANQMAQMMPQAGRSGAPPPLPGGAALYHVGLGGEAAGPFDRATLATMVQNGTVGRDTLVWREGMAGWTAGGSLPELSSLFGGGPPPLPKQ